MPENHRRQYIRNIVLTALLIALAIASATAWLHRGLAQSPLKHVDARAETHLEETMTRAAYTFAAVRGINALISMIQGTQLAVSPAGVGVSLSVGEILDPINDLAERFSWIMLVSTTSLGLQRVLMEMSNWIGIQCLLTASLMGFALSLWIKGVGRMQVRRLAWRTLALALVVRFFIPFSANVSESVYTRFLAARYANATQALETLRRDLRATATIVAQDPAPSEPQGYIEDMRQLFQETRDLIDIRRHIDVLKIKLTHLSSYTVNLIVVFSLQTILLPLFVLWLLTRFVRSTPHLVVAPLAAGLRNGQTIAQTKRNDARNDAHSG